jgi:predicted glutamine amidotransferase
MCKLFLSFEYPNSKKLLKDFLKKGNDEHLEYGYGIGWHNEIWNTYKCNCFHITDPNNKKIIKEIDSKIILGHIRNIYHENMTPQQICNELKIENVHPFQHKNYLFMHHGDIFLEYKNDLINYQLGHNDKEFKNVMKSIIKHISPEFKTLIKGKTDSEIMFYLLLSIQKLLIQNQNQDEKTAIIHSFYILNNILDCFGVSNSSNIVFTNNNYIFIAKIYKNNSTKKLKNPDLFIDTKNGILISNYKLMNKMNSVEKNMLYIIEINTSVIEGYKL